MQAETCAIELVYIKKPLIGHWVRQWQAKLAQAGETTIVGATEPMSDGSRDILSLWKEQHQLLVAQLMAEGWEVASTNTAGDVTLMKRSIRSDAPRDTRDALLAQLERLTSLHDRGGLTDDEFARAKNRLLGND